MELTPGTLTMLNMLKRLYVQYNSIIFVDTIKNNKTMGLHLLFSQKKDDVIQWFDKFDKNEIKTAIVEHLKQSPEDVLEHCKEFSKSDTRKYAGYDILNFYQLNAKGEPCLVVTKGNKEYLRKLKI